MVLIFYLLVLIPMVIHYFFTSTQYNWIFFVKQYLGLIARAYICYYYLNQMYLLYEKHSFLTKLGVISILISVIYISVIGVYFLINCLMLGSKVFYCSNPEWFMITLANFVFSIIFISVGAVVTKDLKTRDILYKQELMMKLKDLHILIITFVWCSLIELVSFFVFMIIEAKECLININSNISLSIFLVILLRVLSDYPLISVILYQFWKIQRQHGLSRIRFSVKSDQSSEYPTIPKLVLLEPEKLSHNFSLE